MQQSRLFAAVVARLDGVATDPAPDWALDEVRGAGLATGLTALAGVLGLFDDAPPEVRAHVSEQREQVAARNERFTALVPHLLDMLADSDVTAVPVKGAVLTGADGSSAVWPWPRARPMSDVDLLVPSRSRAQASAVLQRAGFRWHSTAPYEDTFLAWGDGGVGRVDGESVHHNGRVEVHPGWQEFLHGYSVVGFDMELHLCDGPSTGRRLSPPAFAAHVVGHLASTVVRAEVRAVNVLDVLFLHRAGLDWRAVADVMREIDPRLTAPGLWMVHELVPGTVPESLVQRELVRLDATVLSAAVDARSLWRDPGARTPLAWRWSFARGSAERVEVLRQMAVPAGSSVRQLPGRAIARVRR